MADQEFNSLPEKTTLDGTELVLGASSATQNTPQKYSLNAQVIAAEAPTSGTWKAGQVVWSSMPATYAGWICSAPGTPGTWRRFGVVESETLPAEPVFQQERMEYWLRAPMAPVLTGSQPNPDNYADTEHGPRAGGPHNWPTSYVGTTLVTDPANLVSSWNSLDPGEAVVIQDGTYTNFTGTYSLSREGQTAEAPLYLVAQTPGGVTIQDCDFTLLFSKDHVRIQGINFVRCNNGASQRLFDMREKNWRISNCTFTECGAGGTGTIFSENYTFNEDRVNLVIDDCTFDANNNDAVRTAISIRIPAHNGTDVVTNPHGIHIHHCSFLNNPWSATNGREAISLGDSSNSAVPDTGGTEAPTTSDRGGKTDYLIENCLVDGWGGEDEVISLKGNHGVVRNNRIVNTPGGAIVVRSGRNCLVYGNWLESTRGMIRFGSDNAVLVFNYIGWDSTVFSDACIRLHPGTVDAGRYDYREPSNSVIKHNVFTRQPQVIEALNRGTGTFKANPSGMVLEGNDFYSTTMPQSDVDGAGNFEDSSDGHFTESDFRANNTWGVNSYSNSNLAVQVTISAGHFVGPGDTLGDGEVALLADVYGRPTQIPMPSWWK